MNFWTAAIVVMLIWGMVSVMKSRHQASRGHAAEEGGSAMGEPQRQAELKREIAELRERVQVLERIATDNPEARRLSAEIDRLRDQP